MKIPRFMAHGGRGYDTKERFYNADEGLKVRHTAGPWSVVGGIVIGNGYELADCRASYVSKDESLANAHLIASAPELLEACKLLAKVFNASNFTDRGGYGPMLTALIAKAEGRA